MERADRSYPFELNGGLIQGEFLSKLYALHWKIVLGAKKSYFVKMVLIIKAYMAKTKLMQK